MPGIFNLGGDLKFFVDMITSGDRETLQNYAELSIDVLYANFVNLNADVRTISLGYRDSAWGRIRSSAIQ